MSDVLPAGSVRSLGARNTFNVHAMLCPGVTRVEARITDFVFPLHSHDPRVTACVVKSSTPGS